MGERELVLGKREVEGMPANIMVKVWVKVGMKVAEAERVGVLVTKGVAEPVTVRVPQDVKVGTSVEVGGGVAVLLKDVVGVWVGEMREEGVRVVVEERLTTALPLITTEKDAWKWAL